MSIPLTTANDVAVEGTGFIASGTGGDRGQADLALWRSANGGSWFRAGTLSPVFVEPGFQAGAGVAVAGRKIIVVGNSGAANAGLWLGDR